MKKLRIPTKRALSAVAVFGLVAAGVYAAVPGREKKDAALVAVVVATGEITEGTPSDAVRREVAVRMVPPVARAAGALSSVSDIPDGVLAYVHVNGQQLLVSSFARDRVRSIGTDYVAVSVTLDTQRWAGPILQAGRRVEVWDAGETGSKLVAADAVVLGAPSPDGVKPEEDTVISIGVRKESVAAVLLAAANKRVWLVSR